MLKNKMNKIKRSCLRASDLYLDGCVSYLGTELLLLSHRPVHQSSVRLVVYGYVA